MRKLLTVIAIGLVAASFACGSETTPPVIDDGDTLIVPPDTTPPVPVVRAVTMVGAGNISRCTNNNDEATARIIDSLSASDTTVTVVALGDIAFPSGRASDFTTCYGPTWGRFIGRTRAVIGNHEYDSSSTGDGFFTYFGDKGGPAGKGFYSFDVGAWHVIVLNLQNPSGVPWGPSSEQQDWLVADLAANASKKCTIAMWHDPRFLSSSTAGFTERPNQKSVWQLLYGAGVDIVLNGGQHIYERMAALNADGQPDSVSGIVQFNAGLGGESALGQPSEVSPHSRALNGSDYGVLKLTLRDNQTYAWQYLSIAGRTYTDSGSGSCH